MGDRILLSLCHMSGREMDYISAAFRDNWVVPLGPCVDEFERRLEAYLGIEEGRVVALSAGTAAIHLGLVALGVTAGDEVICQSFTFAASANPITYLGASPVFVGSEPDTWNMSPTALEKAIKARYEATGRFPRAIIAVHLYGVPAKWDEISAVADKFGIPVLEDAAEALGSEYHGIKCGTLGRYGVLSFNGNKIITTSGGGALVCPDVAAAKRVKYLATQAREPRPYYYHVTTGYNYRLSNICAAIGCGQMEVLQQHVDRRRQIHGIYAQALADVPGLKVVSCDEEDCSPNYWLTTVLFTQHPGIKPEEVRLAMENQNIETRWLWRPMHMQPVFAGVPYYGDHTSDELFEHGLCLPSGSGLTDSDIYRVIECLTNIIVSNR